MADSTIRPDASLPELLAERARAASDARLAADAAGGALVAVAALLWRPPFWVALLSAALCFAAFGTWGAADRRLRLQAARALDLTDYAADVHRTAAPLLAAVRSAAAVTGGAAAVTLVLSVLGVLIGRIIS